MVVRLIFVMLTSWLLLTHRVHAGDAVNPLKWDQTKFVLHASPTDEKATVTYKFHNAGKAPVTVSSVRTTCGCIVAKADRKTYAPGDTGKVTATFWFGNRSGRHVNQIWVVFEDEQEREAALELDVTIPPLLKIEPLTLVWTADEVTQAKTISVRNAQDKPVHISGVTCDPAILHATTDTVKDGCEYRVTVMPVTTKGPVETTLTMITDFPADSPRIFHVRVVIHGAPDHPSGKQ